MKNKISYFILFVFLFSFSKNIFAQESKWAIGASFSTEQTYAKFGDNPPFALGFTTGLNAIKKINKHFEFATGLLYSQKVTTDDYSYANVNWEWGIPNPLPLRTKYISSNNYLDIPVKVYFVAGNHKLKFISSLGFTSGIWMNTVVKGNTNYADGTNQSTETIYSYRYYFVERLHISPTASMGLQYDLKNKMFLRLETTYTTFPFHTISLQAIDYTTFYSFGLNLSVYRRF